MLSGMSCALKQKILEMDSRVPRYTSYPTAPHFKALETQSVYTDWLEDIPQSAAISLYIHVPFCPKLCWYCGCNTKITRRYAPVEDYAHLLLREIDLLRSHIGGKRAVQNIHFGGGSPSMLRAQDFALIMEKLYGSFTITDDAEIAIELDPRNVTEGRVATYAKHGVNRVSLGVQDFDERVLASVNRPQPFHLSYKTVQLLHQYGIEVINLDLMYGLPHQTPKTIIAAIDKALALQPDRIAFFGYAHVPWVKKHMRLIDDTALPDKDLRYDLFHIGAQRLQQAGYVGIGIDHFAKADDALCTAAGNGTLHRNFQGYTTDPCDVLIGLGVSSIGQLPQGYVQNSLDMPGYQKAILAGTLPAAKYCPTDHVDHMRAAVIECLMCNFEADVREIAAAHGVDGTYFNTELAALKTYETLGFIEIDRGVITIKPEAKLMARSVCAVFDAYLTPNDAAPRHAQAI